MVGGARGGPAHLLPFGPVPPGRRRKKRVREGTTEEPAVEEGMFLMEDFIFLAGGGGICHPGRADQIIVQIPIL